MSQQIKIGLSEHQFPDSVDKHHEEEKEEEFEMRMSKISPRARIHSVNVRPNAANKSFGMALNPNLRQIQENDYFGNENLCLIPPGQKYSKKEDMDKHSNSSASHSASGSSASSASNNSRAHLYKVSQINFIKKQPGTFNDNFKV